MSNAKVQSPHQFSPWTTLVLALLILASVIGLDLYNSYKAITSKEQARLANQTEIVAANLSQQLQSTNNALEAIRAELPWMMGHENGLNLVNQQMRAMVASMTGVRAILLVNGNGECIASNRKELIGMDFRDGERFQTMHKDSDPALLYVSPPFQTPLDAYAMSVGKIILDNRDKFNGYVLAVLDPEYFSTLLNSVRFAPDMRTRIVHGDGKIIFKVPYIEGTARTDMSAHDTSFFKQHMSSGHSSNIFEGASALFGDNRLVAYRSIRPTHTQVDEVLVVGVSRAMPAMYAGWYKDLTVRSALFLAIAVISIIGMFVQLRRRRAFIELQAVQENERTQNVSILMESELRYRQLNQRHEEVIWGTDAGTWEWSLQSDSASINERWAQMLGYSLEDLTRICNGTLTKSALATFIHPDSQSLIEEQLQRCFIQETDILECEIRLRHKDGHLIWVLVRGRVVEWFEGGQPIRMSGTMLDICARKESEERLQYTAHYDLLTGLPNRVLLADRLQHAIAQCLRRGDSLAVVFLDLDDFKEINDRYGHKVGDELLIALAQRMKTVLREVDTFARFGGDEFVAVLVDLDQPQTCLLMLERLLVAAAEPLMIADTLLQVSASIGVTLVPKDIGDADQLLRHADQAMCLAKFAGKNCYRFFDLEQAAAIQEQRDAVEQLHHAIVMHELVLHYQPKVNMKTGELIGVEALVRWQHPERGLLPPSAFLPFIETETGISIELGEWVIECALKQMEEWQTAGANIPVSVNIGALQLQHANFVAHLSALLDAHPAVPPGWLELEILETSALDEITHISGIMLACRKLGVRFALDDFGTGYSSLTYLKNLPVDALKIDQTFVRDMLDDPEDLAIVEGVVGLALAFKRAVIAEGVETIEHGEFLLSLGCELAQGYAIARPMLAADMLGWVATWRPPASWQESIEQPRRQDDRIVLYADIKHQQWIRKLEAFLAGQSDAPPSLEIHVGYFDHWLETYGRANYSTNFEFLTVIDLHQRLHTIGRELVEMYWGDGISELQTRIAELHALHEDLIANLRKLIFENNENQ